MFYAFLVSLVLIQGEGKIAILMDYKGDVWTRQKNEEIWQLPYVGYGFCKGDRLKIKEDAEATLLLEGDLEWKVGPSIITLEDEDIAGLVEEKKVGSSPIKGVVKGLFKFFQEKFEQTQEGLMQVAGVRALETVGGKTPVILGPRNSSIMTTTPFLEWSEVDGAIGYQITIYDNEGLVFSTTLIETKLDYTGPELLKGKKYSWFVNAITERASFPSVCVSFTILEDEKFEQVSVKQREISELELSNVSKYLLLASFYEQEGLYMDAMGEYCKILVISPDNKTALLLLDQLHWQLGLSSPRG